MLCHQYIATAATVAARVWSARLVDARSTRSCSCSSRSSSDGGTLPCREREALERVREAVLRKELPRAQPLEPVRVAAGKQGVLAAQTRQHWARRPLLRPTNATRVLCHAVVAALFTQKHTRAKKRKRGRERERERKKKQTSAKTREPQNALLFALAVFFTENVTAVAVGLFQPHSPFRHITPLSVVFLYFVWCTCNAMATTTSTVVALSKNINSRREFKKRTHPQRSSLP